MKKLILLISFFLLPILICAQSDTGTYLWPLEGVEAGTGILYPPQSYIDGEFNFGELFLTAPEGSVVIAPCNGTITHLNLAYRRNLTNSLSYRLSEGESFYDAIQNAKEGLDKSIDIKYYTGLLTFRTEDGNNVSIFGLTGDEVFKTGQKISKGTPLGTVGYSYRNIMEPGIIISVSHNNRVADPMSPFGIKSTFVPSGEVKPVASLTKEQAIEDFTIYIDILKEVYPGLHNVVTESELKEYTESTIALIEGAGGDIQYNYFRYIMMGAVAKIHDSHISMQPTRWRTGAPQSYQPEIWFGFIGGKLICTNATKKYEHLLEKEIISVNGIPADSIKAIIYNTTTGYDAAVEHYKEYNAGFMGFGSLFRPKLTFDMAVDLSDGEKVEIKGYSTRNGMPPWKHNFSHFLNLNRHTSGYKMELLSDSTAYLGLSTFQLNQVQVEEIYSFIDSVSAVPNLIIDVRNNNGGHVEVLNKLYSYIAGEPMMLGGYYRVNKKGQFDAFKYSPNYMGVEEEQFPDYAEEAGREGYYLRNKDNNSIIPDSVLNYKGRIYVLANENSVSAATVFPALLVRNHRGVVVGRETRTAYHFMNAMKSMEVILPNSEISIKIPLVEIVFDTVVNNRVPYGRGVIPDYIVSLTYEEMTATETDAILDYTLELIDRGHYITGDNPFAVIPENQRKGTKKISTIIWILIGVTVVAGTVIVWRKRSGGRCSKSL